MQSGIKRKTFDVGPSPIETANRIPGGTKKRTERAITGLASDSLNRVVIASTLDGTLNVGFCSTIITFSKTASVL